MGAYQYVDALRVHILGLVLNVKFEAQFGVAVQESRQQRHDDIEA